MAQHFWNVYVSTEKIGMLGPLNPSGLSILSTRDDQNVYALIKVPKFKYNRVSSVDKFGANIIGTSDKNKNKYLL